MKRCGRRNAVITASSSNWRGTYGRNQKSIVVGRKCWAQKQKSFRNRNQDPAFTADNRKPTRGYQKSFCESVMSAKHLINDGWLLSPRVRRNSRIPAFSASSLK